VRSRGGGRLLPRRSAAASSEPGSRPLLLLSGSVLL